MWLSLNVCTLSLLRVAACSLSLEAVHSLLVTVSSQPAPSEASFLTTLYPWLHLSLYASRSPRPSMLSLMPGPPHLVRADGKPHM